MPGISKLFKSLIASNQVQVTNNTVSSVIIKSDSNMVDVIIIGAGLTGLTLANLLIQDGRSVVVLEARDRIGGRIHTHKTSDGAEVEMGATWYFPHFSNLWKHMKSLNMDLMEQYMFRIKGGT